jgi:hypothetical protein
MSAAAKHHHLNVLLLLPVLLVLFPHAVGALSIAPGMVTRIAGRSEGDGVPPWPLTGDARTTFVGTPLALATDPTTGHVYFLTNLSSVYKLDTTTSSLTLVAGNGTTGPGVDGVRGNASALNVPRINGLGFNGGLVVNSSTGDLIIADTFNHRIRRVSAATGMISTIAGSGQNGLGADGDVATATNISYPTDLVFDGAGNLLFADTGSSRIRKVWTNGTITTVAGGCKSGCTSGSDWNANIDGTIAVDTTLDFKTTNTYFFNGTQFTEHTSFPTSLVVIPPTAPANSPVARAGDILFILHSLPMSTLFFNRGVKRISSSTNRISSVTGPYGTTPDTSYHAELPPNTLANSRQFQIYAIAYEPITHFIYLVDSQKSGKHLLKISMETGYISVVTPPFAASGGLQPFNPLQVVRPDGSIGGQLSEQTPKAQPLDLIGLGDNFAPRIVSGKDSVLVLTTSYGQILAANVSNDTLAQPLGCGTQNFTSFNNRDLDGALLSYFLVPDADACRRMCCGMPPCSAFVLDRNGATSSAFGTRDRWSTSSTCYLYANATQLIPASGIQCSVLTSALL